MLSRCLHHELCVGEDFVKDQEKVFVNEMFMS